MKRESKTVLAVYGEKSERSKKFVGKSVGEAKRLLKEKLGLPDEAVAEIDGEPANEHITLSAGATLRFELPSVKVTCGANEVEEAKFIGESVAYVRKAVKESLNIPKGAAAVFNGSQLDKDGEKKTILKAQDIVEFVKQDGTKG